MKRTNYVETVGLITIGFSIQQTIFGKLELSNGSLSGQLGLDNEFGQGRFLIILLQCLLIVISLSLLQKVEYEKSIGPSDYSLKTIFIWIFRKWRINEKLRFFSILAQAVCFTFTWEMFGNEAGASLAVGFLLVNASILREIENSRSDSD